MKGRELIMVFRIMARNKEQTEAYAELLSCVELMADGRVFCIDLDGGASFTDRDAIMYDPTIIKDVCRSSAIYKINLDGTTIQEQKRAKRK